MIRHLISVIGLLGGAGLVFLSGCQTSDNERSVDSMPVLRGSGYSVLIPTGWQVVDPLSMSMQNAPMELIAGASGRLKSRSDFSPMDERTLTNGSSWILVLSGNQAAAIQSSTDWVKVFSGSDSNIRTRSSQAMTMALSVPTSPPGMYSEYIVANRGRSLLSLAGFSKEEDAAGLSSALARMVSTMRMTASDRIEERNLGSGSDRFLR
jgi:hypothetical protein